MPESFESLEEKIRKAKGDWVQDAARKAEDGDWVQDSFLRVLAADLLEEGEPLPVPLRNYIVASLVGSQARPIAAEFRELCLLMVRALSSYLQPEISREEVEDSAVKTIERIRQAPEKFTHGRRLPESLRELESVVVWILFMVNQWEITSTNVNDARKLLSWQDAVEAVSEALDPDREAAGEKRRSGYSPRSIANTLEYFMGLAQGLDPSLIR
ncbi:MAG: hypothetical protein ACJ76Y_27290 [Thermoanaerobaculia bacterium]